MFDFLFGWRKASKCKKLIKRFQCRVKLLKNKRCSIVNQIRQHVAQLLRDGHNDAAFNRVEQLYKDESIVVVYDLLDHFCEFIIINLSYIRKHKDCPNDINEAVSSLIFASARCGDLPELRAIRALFVDRYGQKFVTAALGLLPGSMVNRQIEENLSIISVSDDVKYRLVDEIARKNLEPVGPLALGYCSKLQLHQENKNVENPVPSGKNFIEEKPHIQPSKVIDTQDKIVYINILVNDKEHDFSSVCSSEKTLHLDEEVEEFQSPSSEDENFQDQRFFVFKLSVLPTSKKFQEDSYEGYEVQIDEMERFRVHDIEEDDEILQRDISHGRYSCKSQAMNQTRLRNIGEVQIDECESWNDKANSRVLSKLNIGEKYHKKNSEVAELVTTMERSRVHDTEDEMLQRDISFGQYSCKSHTKNQTRPKDSYEVHSDEHESWNDKASSSVLSKLNLGEKDHKKNLVTTMKRFRVHDIEEEHISHGRYSCEAHMMNQTMPKDNSFTFQNLGNSKKSSPPHVHPKLPDYDELTAKFLALKKAYKQRNLHHS